MEAKQPATSWSSITASSCITPATRRSFRHGTIGLLEPDIALFPIGDHYTMGPRSATEAIRLLGVKTVVPMHFGTFPILTGTPEQLRQESKDVDGLEIAELEPASPGEPAVP